MVLVGRRGSAIRDVRRAARRVRRALRPRNLITGGILLGSLLVILASLSGPPSRATVYRTEPVLRALGMPEEEPELTALAAVPSLSVSPRFVLPLLREDTKRRLLAPPLELAEPEPSPVPAPPEPAPAVAAVAPPVVALAPPPAPTVDEPPRVVAKPRAVPALTTAVTITPVLPRAEPPRRRAGAELAIIIDDLGPAAALTRRAIALPRPVTLAFLPYADDLPELTAAARARGHEVFLHLPMQPMGNPNPGPNAILVGLGPAEIERRLDWAFSRLPLATGVNNHMGSRATSDPETMLQVLRAVQRRGLSFVDSRTSPLSVAEGLAARLGLPHAARDVFLDNIPARPAILDALAAAERTARRRGSAVAIGHPYPATLGTLEQWIPEAERRGLRIVRVQDVIERPDCDEPRALQVSACVGPDCPPPPG